MGYSLGIYGKVTRDDLKRIKNIRNVFAYSFRPITFDTPEVAKECLELCYLDHLIAKWRAKRSPERAQRANNPRQNFIETAKMLVVHLHAVGFPKKYKRIPWGKMP
jgi:hypothetical protein